MSLDVEYAIKKDVRNNPVVREVDLEQKREFVRTACMVGLIVIMLLFSAWQHFKIVRHGYDVETLRQQVVAEESLHRQLQLDLYTLRRPQSIEERAMRELNLEPAMSADVLVIERVGPPTQAGAVVAGIR
jgi:hypothetical protein